MNKVQVLSDHISFDIAMIAKKKATGRKSKSIAHVSLEIFYNKEIKKIRITLINININNE